MNICWVTSESVPFAKTGGLADVSYSLPAALAERGHEVSVIMPYYPREKNMARLDFDGIYSMLEVPLGESVCWAQIRKKNMARGLTYYFIEYNSFFDRPNLYDWNGQEYEDNAERFIFFSRAAMQCVIKMDLTPDILHLNDWHSALCSVYLKSELYSKVPDFASCRSIMTIHNIGYQGNFDVSKFHLTGLPWNYFNFRCLEYYNRINLLKGGIMCADFVNTVSPSYAEEILSPEFGFGLDSALRHCAYRSRLRGILNGIDVKVWDPANDPALPKAFSASDPAGKRDAKKALRKEFGFTSRKDVPLFAVISRLAFQKGLDVFADALDELLADNEDAEFILVGTGDKHLEWRFSTMAEKYSERFKAYIGLAPERLSHLVEGGADFFVMPSRYEPCGLNQIYSMRYGTLPIVRSTGGLADTVINYNAGDVSKSRGFVLWDLYGKALADTIRWAAATYRGHRQDITAMRKNAMSCDFSWNSTATEYEKMYIDAHK